jgi:hypothetical protein
VTAAIVSPRATRQLVMALYSSHVPVEPPSTGRAPHVNHLVEPCLRSDS